MSIDQKSNKMNFKIRTNNKYWIKTKNRMKNKNPIIKKKVIIRTLNLKKRVMKRLKRKTNIMKKQARTKMESKRAITFRSISSHLHLAIVKKSWSQMKSDSTDQRKLGLMKICTEDQNIKSILTMQRNTIITFIAIAHIIFTRKC